MSVSRWRSSSRTLQRRPVSRDGRARHMRGATGAGNTWVTAAATTFPAAASRSARRRRCRAPAPSAPAPSSRGRWEAMRPAPFVEEGVAHLSRGDERAQPRDGGEDVAFERRQHEDRAGVAHDQLAHLRARVERGLVVGAALVGAQVGAERGELAVVQHAEGVRVRDVFADCAQRGPQRDRQQADERQRGDAGAQRVPRAGSRSRRAPARSPRRRP